ncbi:thiol peroxidase [Phaeocystidibacter luteus]|uniref:Thiol peroxidase n=1 Tax=Phaeocystidibacter luteus TaxID=911197 RepID=A0A6N6RMC4_9FLAO|nr:thiol peroxidase [Phaeocystidibacter luteus]KAB2814716.1 thiol peroxidase [Phaeocystidibacter luteus]
MATTALKGNPVQLKGELPTVGTVAPDFTLTQMDLSDVSLDNFKGKKIVLNIFPSVDTGICAASVRKFNEESAKLDNTVVLCVSRDLPFAHNRFCGAEGIEGVVSVSQIRNTQFMDNYGVELADGPMAGLLARAVVVLNENHEVVYTELVPEITTEPNYDAATAALG